MKFRIDWIHCASRSTRENEKKMKDENERWWIGLFLSLIPVCNGHAVSAKQRDDKETFDKFWNDNRMQCTTEFKFSLCILMRQLKYTFSNDIIHLISIRRQFNFRCVLFSVVNCTHNVMHLHSVKWSTSSDTLTLQIFSLFDPPERHSKEWCRQIVRNQTKKSCKKWKW